MKKLFASMMAALFLTVAGSSAVDAASYHEKAKSDPHYEEREISTEYRPHKKKSGPPKGQYEHRNMKEDHHKDRDHRKNDPRRDNSKAKYQNQSSDNQKQEAPKKAGPRESQNN